MKERKRRTTYGRKWLAYGLIGLGVLIYCRPLFDYQQYHAGGTGDPLAHSAQLVWFCDNFFSYNFDNKHLFADTGINMAANYDMPLWQAFACIARPLGPVGMYNLVVVAQMMSLFGVLWWVSGKYVTDTGLKIAMTWLIGFSSFALARMTAHVALLSTVWGTVWVFHVFERLEIDKRMKVIKAFVVLALVCLSAWQNIANLMPLVMVWLVVHWWRSAYRRQATINLAGGMMVMTAVMAYMTAPMVWAYTQMKANVVPGVYWTFLETYNADVASYFLPWREHGLYKLLPESITGQMSLEKFGGVDPLVLGLLVPMIWLGLRRRFEWSKTRAGLVAMYAVLALGPILRLGNKVIMELPYYQLLAGLPPLSLTRTPARLLVVFGILATIVVFGGLEKIWKRLGKRRGRWIGAGLAGYAWVWTVLLPGNFVYPHFDYRARLPESVRGAMAQDERQVKVLNLPRALGRDQSQNFLQAFHGKPLVAGYVSYAAQTRASQDFLSQHPLYRWLYCFNEEMPYAVDDFPVVEGTNNYGTYFVVTLAREDVGYVIVNKELTLEAGCKPLYELTREMMPNFAGLRLWEENERYMVYAVEENYTQQLVIYGVYDRAFVDDKGIIRLVGMSGSIDIYATGGGMVRVEGKFEPMGADNRVGVSMHRIDRWLDEGVSQRMMEFPIYPGLNRLRFNGERCEQIDVDDEQLCVSVAIKDLKLELVE